jgi:hypothetical protein
MRTPGSMCVCVFIPHQLLNASTNLYETCMYDMAPEPVSKAYFLNSSHQSLCTYVHPPIIAMQQLGKIPPITAR